jgi:hypothetical protein
MAAAPDASTPEGLAVALSALLQDAIPRHYEKKKDWDRTKRITTGLRSEGNFFDFNLQRRKTEVKHGNWYHYRIHMVEPDKRLEVRIENLHSISPGRIAFTMYLASPLKGWAQTRIYNRGVHFITLTAEGQTTLRLWIDCEIALALNPAALFSEVEVTPVVTEARLELADFELERISKASGPLVEELGKGLRYVILEELEGPTLVAKLNRAIEKKRDRLKFSPGKMLKLPAPQAETPAATQAN